MNRIEEMKARQAKRCRHFTGMMNNECAVDIPYKSARDETARPYKYNCFGECCGLCAEYSPFTAKELAEQEAERNRVAECINRGVSPCCDAPIDTSQVITDGRYSGHGPRYCSKCKKLVFLV